MIPVRSCKPFAVIDFLAALDAAPIRTSSVFVDNSTVLLKSIGLSVSLIDRLDLILDLLLDFFLDLDPQKT